MMTARRADEFPDMSGVRGELRADEPMAGHTSWRAGGRAEWYFVPADADDLGVFLSRLPASMPVLFIGLGSNLLVRDGGVRGVVVATHKALSAMRLDADGLLYVEAGVASAQVARFAARHDLVGGEFLAGIPGCMGGALAMNAGAFGGETWRVVYSADLVDRTGTRRTLPAAAFETGYRHVVLPGDAWFVAARLRLAAGDGAAGKREIAELLRRRADSQPVQSANAGSVFTNPPGDHAARLIEYCGLKGFAIGDAQVSEKHANFIINRGSARASDIEKLVAAVRLRVRSDTGVDLKPEVRFAGEHDE